jgi:outer membrane protein assembly factor BamD (BamD/ComL family)
MSRLFSAQLFRVRLPHCCMALILIMVLLSHTGQTQTVSDGIGDAPTLRDRVAALAEQGLMDSAYALVLIADDGVDPREKALLAGKLSPRGDQAAKALQTLKTEGKKSPEQAEALYLLGQYQYAAGRYQMAIPEFREYLRRYPKGEDADRATYWMANACLHLALTQPERSAYLDSGLLYLSRMPSLNTPGAYYASLAAECAARILLAREEYAAADSVLREAMRHAPEDEKPALMLLRALWLRTTDRSYADAIQSLKTDFPRSPEAEYVRRLKSQLPKAASIPRKDESDPAATQPARATKPNGADSVYALQVGSFAQRENAEALMQQLVRKGMRVELESHKRGHQFLTLVLVGQFQSAAEAEVYGTENLKPLQVMYQVRRRPTTPTP